MDKKTLLAVVLSMMVLVVWQVLFPPPAPVKKDQQEQQVPGAKETVVPQEIETPEGAVFLGEGEKVSAKAIDEGRSIVVSTPIWKATFITRGATLKSFEVNNFRQTLEPSSLPVNLIDAQSMDLYPLRTDFFTGKVPVTTRGVEFKASTDSLSISGDEEKDIEFEADIPKIGRVKKIFRFKGDSYKINATIKIAKEETGQGSYDGMILPFYHGLPPEEKSDRYENKDLLVFLDGKAKDLKREPLSKLVRDKAKGKDVKFQYKQGVMWAGFDERYFLTVVLSSGDISPGILVTAPDPKLVEMDAFYLTRDKDLSEEEFSFAMYIGPKGMSDLEGAERSLRKAVNLGMFSPISVLFLWLLKAFYNILGNYGIAIIILTILVRLAMLPLTLQSMKSMKQMQKLQPEFSAIKEKYKGETEKLNQEIMAMYKRYKINPLGGCLPMVLQLPVFYGLYYALLNSIELRQAPFFFWIKDLSAKDPYYVTPLIMGVSMFLQQKMTPTPPVGDPTQAKILQYMPLIFTFMFLNFPSGLVIYWLFSNMFSIIQQQIMNRIK